MPSPHLLDQLNTLRTEFSALSRKLNHKLFPDNYHSQITSEINLLLNLSEYFYTYNSFISDTLALDLIYWFDKINSFLKSLDSSDLVLRHIPSQIKNYKLFESIIEELFIILKDSQSKKLRDELLSIGNENLKSRISIDSRIDFFEDRLKENQYRIQEANEKLQKSLLDIVNKSKEDSNKIENLKDSFSSEIANLKESYKFDISQFELFKQQKEFFDTAINLRAGLKFWIGSIVGLAILLIFLSWLFFYQCWFDLSCLVNNTLTPNDQSALFYFEIVKRVTLRIITFSILIIILRFCIRNYNASKHNMTINLHKANCFGAAFKIIASIENETTKQEILKQAGTEIFSHHSTGYISTKESQFDLDFIDKLISILNKTNKQ